MKKIGALKRIGLREKPFYWFNKLKNKINSGQFASSQNILNKAKLNHFEVSQSSDFYILSQKNQRIYFRKNSSDLQVFQQVFLNREYDPVVNIAIDNDIKINFIVDAGANIGLTALKFSHSFPNAQMVCLEPDPQNHHVLEKNLRDGNQHQNCHIWQKALWSSEQSLELINDFRDRREWSRRVDLPTENTSNHIVQSTSLNSIIAKFNLSEISILKIDIEGAESEIFSKNRSHDFLSIVKIIAIEIHDEVANRKDIYEILRSYNFFIFSSGELTIGVNNTLCCRYHH